MNNMKRHAIIIESGNVKGQDDLPGARLDFANWLRFLKSELGGAWEEGEITPMHKPTIAEVKTALSEHSQDYVFLAFSGHGYQPYDSVLVCLNDNEKFVSERNLTPQFGTVILDCCRGPGDSGRTTVKEAMDSIPMTFALANSRVMSTDLSTYFRRSNIRSAFMQEVRKHLAFEGVRMYACTKGQGAGEDPAAGGLYTTMLMARARTWGSKIAHANQSNVYLTRDVHDDVVLDLQRMGIQQTPVYEPDDAAYPFAIK